MTTTIPSNLREVVPTLITNPSARLLIHFSGIWSTSKNVHDADSLNSPVRIASDEKHAVIAGEERCVQEPDRWSIAVAAVARCSCWLAVLSRRSSDGGRALPLVVPSSGSCTLTHC